MHIGDFLFSSLAFFITLQFRTNSLLFHVDSQTPKIGALLKTTCSLDEVQNHKNQKRIIEGFLLQVCLSDQIEEVGTMYPDRQLELIIRTTKAPAINISYGKFLKY